jgi:dihydrolipoamide dehydrogenase
MKGGVLMVVGDVTTAVDTLVLGAGPGGYVAAIRAAQQGRHVTLVEPGPAGGTCLNQGCIPLKALLSASERYQQARTEDLALMGIAAEIVSFDWPKMQSWKQSVVGRLSGGVSQLLAGHKIERVTGTGWFINAQEMRVEGEYGSLRFKFEQCILATGAQANPVAGLPYDGQTVLTPEQALALTELPTTLSMFGDDYIALELATVFARLGAKVKLYTAGEQFLPGVDGAALRLVLAGLRKLGITIATKTPVSSIAERPLVISNGVRPNIQGLHLDAVGLKLNEQGGIAVNTMQQSSIPTIYAVGDCTGGRPLATIAIKQGKVAADVIGGQRVQFAPLVTPLVVHTTPELATVGATAQEATRAGYTPKTGRFPLAANGRGLTLGADNGVALVVADASNDVLLGVTLVGPRAGDLIGQATLAIEMGATLTDLSEILYAHPSLSEMLQESAENALGRAVHILTKG